MMGLVNLWVLSASRRLENSQVASDKLEAKGIKFLNYEITSIDHSTSTVTTKSNHDKLLPVLGKHEFTEITPYGLNMLRKLASWYFFHYLKGIPFD
jgi:hypothetical protein